MLPFEWKTNKYFIYVCPSSFNIYKIIEVNFEIKTCVLWSFIRLKQSWRLHTATLWVKDFNGMGMGPSGKMADVKNLKLHNNVHHTWVVDENFVSNMKCFSRLAAIYLNWFLRNFTFSKSSLQYFQKSRQTKRCHLHLF